MTGRLWDRRKVGKKARQKVLRMVVKEMRWVVTMAVLMVVWKAIWTALMWDK